MNLNIVAADFDGTIGDTFKTSPNGIGVEACYRRALREMFGSSTLLDDIGGLKNRAPAQIIESVLGLYHSLEERGLRYYAEHRGTLRELVPMGKVAAYQSGDAIYILTETFVRVKLKQLLPEIGEQWPKPYDGVLDYFENLAAQRTAVAIISSGHTLFIEKTFEVWRAQCPKFLVTDDDMRGLGLPPSKASKPSRVLMDVLHMKANAARVKADVRAYIGDCPVKDRGLAWNSDVPFGWFNPDNKDAPQGFGRNEFQFGTWRDLPGLLN